MDNLNNRVLQFVDAPSVLSASTGVIVGNAVIPFSMSVTLVANNVSILGDLDVQGTLSILNATISVLGNSTLNGTLLVTPRATLVTSQQLRMFQNSSVRPVVDSQPTSSSIVFPVATYSSYSGNVGRLEPAQSNLSCYSFGNPDAVYGSSSLTVTLSVNQGCGLSSAEIVGICVGSIVGGALLIVLMALFLNLRRKKLDALTNSEIRANQLEQLDRRTL